jgi:uncharacterized protein (TIGR02217 family)
MSYPVMSTSIPWSLVKNGFHKTPSFEGGTLNAKAATGHRSALSMKPYATWNFDIDINLVLGGEAIQGSVLQMFLGCFLATCGGAGFFLFTDPNDNTVAVAQGCMLNVTAGAATPMGQKGDGTSTVFQLARTIGQGIDLLQQVSGVTVYVNGTATAVTISATGVVTFSVAPAANAVITWAGSFRYLCQFAEDTLKDLSRVAKNSSGWLWSCGAVDFESVFV